MTIILDHDDDLQRALDYAPRGAVITCVEGYTYVGSVTVPDRGLTIRGITIRVW